MEDKRKRLLRKILHWFLLLLGITPFIVAIIYCIMATMLDWSGFFREMNFFEYMFLYSFIYWPSYILGIILIVVSIMLMKKDKKKRRKIDDNTDTGR